MSVVEQTRVVINLQGSCDYAWCAKHAQGLYDQLSVPHYSRGASIMAVPESLEAWRAEHRTARKRADRADRLGYRFALADFSLYADDIYDINTSLEQRQGRPMSDGYTVRRNHGRLSADQTRCPRHRTDTYGVFSGGHLRAYMTIHRAGELAMVSMILGHGEHLRNDVMYLLFSGMIEDQARQGGSLFYNKWDSGTEGLRYYKARVGFRVTDIEWLL